MPSTELIEELRASAETYSFFCYFFLPEVIGKRAFFRAVQRGCALSSIAMESDEAFGIVTLLNTAKRWPWEYYHPPGNLTDDEKNKKPAALYSVGTKGNARKYEGWNHEGANKFNELVARIQKDRKEHTDFDEYFKKKMFIYSEGRYGKKPVETNRSLQQTVIPVPIMQL